MRRGVLGKVELGGKSNISGVAAPFGLLTLADQHAGFSSNDFDEGSESGEDFTGSRL
jgi:hypothetical protein